MFKKICALVLAIAMVLAMGSVAMAGETDHDDTYKGSGSKNAVINGTNIPLTKSIVLFNTDGSDIREPNISFTYTVEPLDETEANQGKPLAGVTVTDDGSENSNKPVTLNVYDGVASAFASTLTLTFSDTKTEGGVNVPNMKNATQSGTELEKTGNLVVNPKAFPHAGIYRFVITETANPTDVTSVGLDARTGDYKDKRYLDVYIKNGDSGLEMYGAVIFKTTETVNIGKDKITTTTEKTTGFEPKGGDTQNYETDNTVDKYHTFNLEVNKTIRGGLADMTHDFPFEITLTGDKSATITADYSNGNATYDGNAPTTVAINTTAAVLKPALSNADSVKITGIPVGTKVLVKETNDTYDEYTPSVTTQTGFTGLALDATAALKKDTSTQLKAAAEITDKTANSVIGLTNTLAEISPTGVVLRVAPYVLILGAGLALLLISRRRKTASEEE